MFLIEDMIILKKVPLRIEKKLHYDSYIYIYLHVL